VKRGFLYLVAIMDWATRKVLSWRLSNTMDARFCVEALQEAIARYGPPTSHWYQVGDRAERSMRCRPHVRVLVNQQKIDIDTINF
jgi:transposase InsO family protein